MIWEWGWGHLPSVRMANSVLGHLPTHSSVPRCQVFSRIHAQDCVVCSVREAPMILNFSGVELYHGLNMSCWAAPRSGISGVIAGATAAYYKAQAK